MHAKEKPTMPHEPSLIRSRYAITIMRSDPDLDQSTIRLLETLASDEARADTPTMLIDHEMRALAAFRSLGEAIRQQIDPSLRWAAARDAAREWEIAASKFD